MSYATVDELRTGISSTYANHPDIAEDEDAEALLQEASDLIDRETLGRAASVDEEDDAGLAVLSRATVKQVEFWLEVGYEHDVAGLTGSVVAGRVQVHPTAPVLGPRAKRALDSLNLRWKGVAAR